jgi:hypothetical protein
MGNLLHSNPTSIRRLLLFETEFLGIHCVKRNGSKNVNTFFGRKRIVSLVSRYVATEKGRRIVKQMNESTHRSRQELNISYGFCEG